MTGFVHSIQSLGTVDGPGIRYVVFLQGCNLRCGCCHNPDTWERKGGREVSAEEIVSKAVRYKEYFGKDGGVTVSGGEPLLQPAFVREVFELCHQNGINTCLDTSGSILNDEIRSLLALTDRVLLDIKYTSDDKYQRFVGCSISAPMRFLSYLNEERIPVTLRQVIIPSLNDREEDILALRAIAREHPCVDHVELLPFRKICRVKYDKMKIPFPFAHLPEPSEELMTALRERLQ